MAVALDYATRPLTRPRALGCASSLIPASPREGGGSDGAHATCRWWRRGPQRPVTVPAADEAALVAALRAGDEDAFVGLVQRLHPSMVRLAMLYTHDRALADEVAQEAWLGVLQQLDRFEGRSTLKTWILRIVVNVAKTRSARERRTVPFSSMADSDGEAEASVPPDRFLDPSHRWAGHWSVPPPSWREVPEERLLSLETRERIEQAIEELPAQQRAVISLRDIEGWSAAEVCDLLAIREGNQRVLLHRARGKVRAALEEYLAKEGLVP